MPGNRARFAAVESRLSVRGVGAVPLSVDMRKIVKAEVVPWEIDEGLYGVAYTTNEGWEGADLIGPKAEAEKIVQAITDQKVVAFDTALKRTDG